MEDMLTKEYVAGFIDGEACIHITKSKHKGYKNYKFELAVSITNTCLNILEQIQKQYGGGISTKKHTDKTTQCYTLKLSANFAETLLKDILSYLIVKKEQAVIALEFKRTLCKQNRWRSEEERLKIFEERNSFYKKLAELKGLASSTYRQQRLNEIELITQNKLSNSPVCKEIELAVNI